MLTFHREGIFLWERGGGDSRAGKGEYGAWEEEDAWVFYSQLPPLRELIPALVMAGSGATSDGEDDLGEGSEDKAGDGSAVITETATVKNKGTLDNALAQLMGKRTVVATAARAAGAHTGPTPQELQRQRDRERKREAERLRQEKARARAEAAKAAEAAAAAGETPQPTAGDGNDGDGAESVSEEQGFVAQQVNLLLSELPQLSNKDQARGLTVTM